MISIKVKMKRGGTMLLEAEGRCVHDKDGAGMPFDEIEDLELFWPRKPRDKKSYPVKTDLIADWSQVEEAFWEACASRAEGDRVDSIIESRSFSSRLY